MARYQLTTQDRSKGGKATASKQAPPGYKSYPQYLGRRGLKRFADRWFEGNLYLAGIALSKIGNWWTDAARWNGAMKLPDWFPEQLTQMLLARYDGSDASIPF